MCYSKEASKNIFILNIIISYILFNYNFPSNSHKILALFFLFVGFMQLFDWIFWSNQDILNPSQASINYNFTKIAMIFNHLQPIILAILIYIYKGHLPIVSQYIILLYTIVITLYTINSYNKIKYTKISIYPKPTLEWNWNVQSYYPIVYLIFLLTLCILFYQNFDYPANIFFIFFSVSTFIFSISYFKLKTIGRFWCKIAAFAPLIIMILINTNILAQ